ncbi:HAD family hydrolase [Streptomyces sp. NPDC054863]
MTIAFFDVDETLLATKSMLDFWDHWTRRPGAKGQVPPLDDELNTLIRSGASRAEQNRAYYRRFAGVPLADVQEAARQWYAGYRERPDAYVTAGLSALARHREAGHAVVLVSGSARPILAPVAQDLGAYEVLSTEQHTAPHTGDQHTAPHTGDQHTAPHTGDQHTAPHTERSILTGEVRHPMIGAAKADAVTGFLGRIGMDPAGCYAYGDHSSDLAMLRAVGHAVVVGADPVLLGQARSSGWPVLPSHTGPKSVAMAAS